MEKTIKDWKDELSRYGLISHTLSDNILERLGGLTVESVTFNPTIETSLMFEELREINEESGYNFFPIGVIKENDIMIVISEKGKIFGMLSDIILKYGDTLEESLNCLLGRNGNIESMDWDYDKW